MSKDPSADEVIELIRAAFADVAPGAMTVHEAEAADDYATAEERRAARTLDPETHWSEVDPRSIAECTTALSHLDPEGWRFYLPAYMVWSIEHPEANGLIVDHTIYSVAPTDDERLRDYQRARFESLTDHQARAVSRFLRYTANREATCDADAARRAIDAYWNRFDA